jgi:hypothetical protein
VPPVTARNIALAASVALLVLTLWLLLTAAADIDTTDTKETIG